MGFAPSIFSVENKGIKVGFVLIGNGLTKGEREVVFGVGQKIFKSSSGGRSFQGWQLFAVLGVILLAERCARYILCR